MKAVIRISFLIAGFFAFSQSMAQSVLDLYVSSSGSASLSQVSGKTTILVLAGGNDAGDATAGSCVIFANLNEVEGGYQGEFTRLTTAINSYDEKQAKGRSLAIEDSLKSFTITGVDDVGICPLNNTLVNQYIKLMPKDERRKRVYLEMIGLAHANALALYKDGMRSEAISVLSSYADNYEPVWLVSKDSSGIVVSAINDYAFFLQEDGQALQSIKYLTDIVASQPKRAVAWLNLADSNWVAGERSDAVKQYARYRELMLQANKKEKIPARVYERSGTSL